MYMFFSVMGAIGGVAGFISMVDLFLDIRNNRFLAVNEFLSGLDETDLIRARAAVYCHEGAVSIDDKDMSMVVNYFHHWGILAKKHYLPLWVFDEGAGAGAIRLYEKSKEYIDLCRKAHNDDTYASGFVWLYKSLSKKNRQK